MGFADGRDGYELYADVFSAVLVWHFICQLKLTVAKLSDMQAY